jgi:hypothetical protein
VAGGVAAAHALARVSSADAAALLAMVRDAYAGGVDVMLWVCAGIAVAAALLAAAFLPRYADTPPAGAGDQAGSEAGDNGTEAAAGTGSIAAAGTGSEAAAGTGSEAAAGTGSEAGGGASGEAGMAGQRSETGAPRSVRAE